MKRERERICRSTLLQKVVHFFQFLCEILGFGFHITLLILQNRKRRRIDSRWGGGWGGRLTCDLKSSLSSAWWQPTANDSDCTRHKCMQPFILILQVRKGQAVWWWKLNRYECALQPEKRIFRLFVSCQHLLLLVLNSTDRTVSSVPSHSLHWRLEGYGLC